MKYPYAIIYTGAPYGDNEQGHIVSRHTTLPLARSIFTRRYGGRTGSLNHQIVRLDASGKWDRSDDLTYRLDNA